MAGVNLTPRELEILVAVVSEMKGDTSGLDWVKIAGASNCNTAKYARDKFGLIRNKLQASASKSGADTNGDAEAADGEAATPNGKAKKKATPRKRKSDGDDTESPTKKKASPRKSKSATPAKAEGDGDVAVKDEPNEAGEAMDAMS